MNINISDTGMQYNFEIYNVVTILINIRYFYYLSYMYFEQIWRNKTTICISKLQCKHKLLPIKNSTFYILLLYFPV